MEPGNTLFEAFGIGDTDDLLVVGDSNVTAAVGIAIAFAKAVDQDAGILVAVIDDTCHGDNIAFDAKVGLEVSGIVPEGNQHLLKLVYGGGHFQIQVLQPCGVDEAHVANGLDGGLFVAQLLNPGQCPDVTVFVGAHGLVLRSLLEDLAQVGHILFNVFFQIDDDTLLGVLQQVGVAEAGVEHEVGQGFDIGHFKGNLLAPLVALNGFPFHMDVGLLLQPLEDGTVVGLGLGAGGEVGQTLDGCGFRQGEL